METQDREGDLVGDSPMSHNDEDISDGEPHSGTEHDDHDSGDDLRRHGILADHNDVLTKLKMQVRDINVRVSNGLSTYSNQDDFENQRNHPNFSINNRPQDGIQFPVPFPFPHPATAFLPPMAPPTQPTSSGSSHSSEGSASSQHTWSFEEQFKQVRQVRTESLTTALRKLYELSDDPRRKEFLDDLFFFMQKREEFIETRNIPRALVVYLQLCTPINRLPIMAKSVLDLFELYNLVVARGGLVDVINKKLWQEIIKGLRLPSSITSAAFTLRTQYMKYLYLYESDKLNLSTPEELKAAIEGNKREGRRNSYGQYDTMARYGYDSPNVSSQQQLNALSLVTQSQLAARMNMMSGGMGLHNGVHHPAHPQSMGPPTNGIPMAQVPNLGQSELDVRVMSEYIKIFNSDMFRVGVAASSSTANSPPTRYRRSPPRTSSPLVMSERSPSASSINSQIPLSADGMEPQREPINLSDSSQSVKREGEAISPQASKRVPRNHDIEGSSSSMAMHIPPQTTNIKIDTTTNDKTGQSNLFVRMEINGTQYQGLLFPLKESCNSQSELASN